MKYVYFYLTQHSTCLKKEVKWFQMEMVVSSLIILNMEKKYTIMILFAKSSLEMKE